MTMQNKRKRMLALLGLVVLAVGVFYAIHWFTTGRYQISTDDADVSGNLVQLMSQTTGNVQAVYADETQWVNAGAPLVMLDGADARLTLDKAEANLAQVVRNVAQQYRTADAASSLVTAKQVALNRARSDLSRRNELVDARAIAREEVEHAKMAVANAQADLLTAQRQRDAAQAMVSHTTLTRHPAVIHAEVTLKQAWLGVQRLIIRAPVSGFVAKRVVQVGERVTPETPLMVIVPPTQIWLDANFKENQLDHVRIGQPVSFTTDLYGKDVTFHGTVAGLSAGTGNVFSLLPAQNATGNWIKVVQRLPVRVNLNQSEITRHPLRLGLSATAVVDVHDQHGKTLTTPPVTAYQTLEYQQNDVPVEQLITYIVRQNSGT